MHLLAAQPGAIDDGSQAVELGQTPGDILFLSAADTELACLAAARAELGAAFPSLRLANLMHLAHNLSIDLYVDEVVAHAKLVVVRLLGGVGYWPYGVEQFTAQCRQRGIPIAFMPGDDQPDAELDQISTVSREALHRLWRYRIHGGADNDRNFLLFAASLIGEDHPWQPPRPLLRAGLYWPGMSGPGLEEIRSEWTPGAPVAPLVFYRALLQAGNLAPVDGLIAALRRQGINPLPVFVSSLKDSFSAELLDSLLAKAPPAIVLNTTAFAVSSPGAARRKTPFDRVDCPVLQVVFAGGTEAAWRENSRGLSPRDLAMNVVLPEVDGRILSRAVSFKTEARYDKGAQISVTAYEARPDRIDFVARLARGWCRLRATPANERRIAIVLANYPNRDGRIGNGVGLDTPESVAILLAALSKAGYRVEAPPADGAALIDRLLAGATNDLSRRSQAADRARLSRDAYERFFATLPVAVRDEITERWGPPDDDPFFEDGAFILSIIECGNIVIGIQPSRGYDIDPVQSYHDPALPPPHRYLAFYAWLRGEFDVQAVVHMGKHGNLEWLPGKAVVLSEDCFPEAAFGPLPHLYPFIVNDPGEGTQAKRRAQAVILDHLPPPLTRAESYGPQKDIEALVDEYYEAAGLDPKRLTLLRRQILDLTRSTGLDKDTGIREKDDAETALGKLDNYLCELKEMQIRNGLHIFGRSPAGGLLDDLLVALTRIPRGDGEGGDGSLLRALAQDLNLGEFDPLDCPLGAPWKGPRPEALRRQGNDPWRTAGDTVERLECLALSLVRGEERVENGEWLRAGAVLAEICERIRPAVEACGAAETDSLLRGLNGRFIEPGPSGAPTRGRLDTLPTGRNFYSVDNRTVPTPAAWLLGWKSASLLVEHYRQTHGAWPATMVITAWGTSNMRTGGEDIAQALALLGVRPSWDAASRRVTGFEVLPLSVLDRPRVDVTLRISGFFRDAFPEQIDLFDSAVRAVAMRDEPAKENPLAARVAREAAELTAGGSDAAAARRRAATRIFGSKPGAYGAGLQALIDERGWETEADLARAYVAWGGYAYGDGAEGRAEHRLFETRLTQVEAVVQNQDNREHDLLDSDDYYQFEGGATAAVRHLSGEQPTVYHNDHSRPERPKIRTLDDEIGRVVRARAVNPKWIAGAMRHGYKGASEMAATVDYLFAFAATTGLVADHHFDLVYDAYIADPAVRDFLLERNRAAAREIAERLLEAQERGLWKPRSNSGFALLQELTTAGDGETP
jgi:cobaltochelatase CobN